jgi:PAS domain S-box-containing protein
VNNGNIVVFIIGILLGAGAATAITLIVLRRRYANHLQSLQMGMKHIADGDLTHQLTVEAGDPLAARFNDMAAQLSKRETIQKNEVINQAIIDSMPDLLFRLNQDGIFLDYRNPRDADLLAPPEFFLGRSVQEVLPPELADQTMRTLKSVLTTGQAEGFEYQLTVDGNLQTYETRYVVVGAGEVLTIVRDITKRKREQELLQVALEQEKQLSELKSRFMTLMTHEFRTPLAVILTSSDLLERYRNRITDEQRGKHFTMIHEQVMHLARVLDDILTLSRAETVGLELEVRKVNLKDICAIASEDVKPHLAQHNVVFSAAGDCKNALLDVRLLRQALTNLLSNAAKYSPAGSSIYFDLMCQEDQAIIRIRDLGIGIPEADQVHLFDVFYRAQNIDETPGLGLGLAIVKHAITAHGGTIAVESTIGVGTTFTVMLPLAMEEKKV